MTLKWSIPELLEHQKGGFSFDATVTVDELKKRDAEIRKVTPVRVTGRADVDRNAVTFFLTVTGRMTLPCALTLVDVDYPFRIETTEIFRFGGHSAPEAEGEENVHHVEGQTVDLLPAVEEAILVEKPMRVVSEEAKNRTDLNGPGWQLIDAPEGKPSIDPRFEKLKEWFNE